LPGCGRAESHEVPQEVHQQAQKPRYRLNTIFSSLSGWPQFSNWANRFSVNREAILCVHLT
jgi:peptide methionine sulfoxide reductase MsrB